MADGVSNATSGPVADDGQKAASFAADIGKIRNSLAVLPKLADVIVNADRSSKMDQLSKMMEICALSKEIPAGVRSDLLS